MMSSAQNMAAFRQTQIRGISTNLREDALNRQPNRHDQNLTLDHRSEVQLQSDMTQLPTNRPREVCEAKVNGKEAVSLISSAQSTPAFRQSNDITANVRADVHNRLDQTLNVGDKSEVQLQSHTTQLSTNKPQEVYEAKVNGKEVVRLISSAPNTAAFRQTQSRDISANVREDVRNLQPNRRDQTLNVDHKRKIQLRSDMTQLPSNRAREVYKPKVDRKEAVSKMSSAQNMAAFRQTQIRGISANLREDAPNRQPNRHDQNLTVDHKSEVQLRSDMTQLSTNRPREVYEAKVNGKEAVSLISSAQSTPAFRQPQSSDITANVRADVQNRRDQTLNMGNKSEVQLQSHTTQLSTNKPQEVYEAKVNGKEVVSLISSAPNTAAFRQTQSRDISANVREDVRNIQPNRRDQTLNVDHKRKIQLQSDMTQLSSNRPREVYKPKVDGKEAISLVSSAKHSDAFGQTRNRDNIASVRKDVRNRQPNRGDQNLNTKYKSKAKPQSDIQKLPSHRLSQSNANENEAISLVSSAKHSDAFGQTRNRDNIASVRKDVRNRQPNRGDQNLNTKYKSKAKPQSDIQKLPSHRLSQSNANENEDFQKKKLHYDLLAEVPRHLSPCMNDYSTFLEKLRIYLYPAEIEENKNDMRLIFCALEAKGKLGIGNYESLMELFGGISEIVVKRIKECQQNIIGLNENQSVKAKEKEDQESMITCGTSDNETDEAISNLNEILMNLNQMDDKSVIQERLLIMYEMAQTVTNVSSIDPTFWPKCLKENTVLQNFLYQATQTDETQSIPYLKLLRNFMRILLSCAKSSFFPNKIAIKSWLSQYHGTDSSSSTMTHATIHNVEDLCRVLHEKFLPEIRNMSGISPNPDTKHSIDIFITIELSKTVKNLLHIFSQRREIYEVILLYTILLPLSYNIDSNTFEILVSEESLEIFVKSSKQHFEEFKKHCLDRRRKTKIQSFLFLLALRNTKHVNDSIKRKQILVRVIQPMRNSIGHSLFQSLCKYLSTRPYLFDDLETTLKQIFDGYEISFSKNVFFLDKLEKSLSERQGTTVISKTINSIPHISTVEIISFLCLGNVYPEKISIEDVLSIKQESWFSENPQEKIAWVILRKLIMCDYRARDNILKEFFSRQDKTKQSQKSFDTRISVDDIMAKLSVKTSSRQRIYHPLDVFLAIFSCCDEHLKQLVVSKLLLCQLAIPFVYRALSNDRLLFSVWPLRSLTAEWKECEVSLFNQSSKCVTFLRFDRPSFSKSKLMNVMLRQNSHGTFHSEDCPLAAAKKDISNGMVEATWYIPSESECDVHPEMYVFLNLRGDALVHEKQVKFLKQISDIIIVLTDIDVLPKISCRECLKSLYEGSASVILLTSLSDEDEKNRKIIKENVVPMIPDDNQRTEFATLSKGTQRRSNEDIKDQIWKYVCQMRIRKNIQNMEDKVKCAERQGIIIDEILNEDCTKGQKYVNSMDLEVGESVSIGEFKKQAIPLQGFLWKEVSNFQKQGLKMGQNAKEELLLVKTREKELREKQIAACDYLSHTMEKFIHAINAISNDKKRATFFLSWLTQKLDENSWAFLPELKQKYNSEWKQYKKARDDSTGNIEVYKERVSLAKADLANASFGLEHLLRELGQIYEAVIESPDITTNAIRRKIQRIPYAVAKLLVFGHFLEIMDGDVSNVPMKWVKAVFSELVKEVGDKKVFVLSVVGIQSSGKSTLLNIMFGLQFPVSAGRCTKGVFMQLLEVRSKNYFGFDYLLIIDAEGLRANDYNQTYDHDNRLATFVIGMGDITMVNIKGENTTEVNEVLQIVVHAFLRLRLANDKLKLQQSCVFVHQNVSSENAYDKLSQDRHTLVDTLDKMTYEAAQQENESNIRSFRDVIYFDSEKHCWYFPEFLSGNPPMAHVNHAYAEKVQTVRKCILESLSKVRPTLSKVRLSKVRPTFSVISNHINDLWNGILSDDFVFSFRNSLEVRIYNTMESKCTELCYKTDMFALRCLEKLRTKDIRCNSIAELTEIKDHTIQTFQNELIKFSNDILEEWKVFYDQYEHKDACIRWNEFKIKSIKKEMENIKRTTESSIIEILHEKRFDERGKNIEKEMQQLIYSTAQEWAEAFKGKAYDETTINDKFTSMWTDYIHKKTSGICHDPTPIEQHVTKKLYSFFPNQSPFLDKELIRCSNSNYSDVPQLEGSITIQHIKEDKHINFKALKQFISYWKKKVLKKAIAYTNVILKELDEYLHTIQSNDSRYKDAYTSTILQMIKKLVAQHDEKEFEFRQTFSVMLSVHACQFAITVFRKMDDKYEEKHNIKTKLMQKKDKYCMMFKSVFCQRTEEINVALIIGDSLDKILKQNIQIWIKDRLVSDILQKFQFSKKYVIHEIMRTLAEEGTFEDFCQYTEDPSYYALKFLKQETDKIDFECSDKNVFVNELKQIIQNLKDAIMHTKVESTTSCSKSKITRWLMMFEIELNERNEDLLHKIKTMSFSDMLKQNIDDLEHFNYVMMEEVEQTAKVVETFQNSPAKGILQWIINPPYDIIMRRLWGCKEYCPICHEPCCELIPEHTELNIKHKCLQHRPLGVLGYKRNNMIIMESCQEFVEDNNPINCDVWSFECEKSGKCDGKHAFIDHAKYLPDWSIQQRDVRDYSEYWKWFMMTFQFQMNFTGASFSEDFEPISKEEALKSLLF